MYFPTKWGVKEPQNPQNHRVVINHWFPEKSKTHGAAGDRHARAIELENFELREQLSAMQQVGKWDGNPLETCLFQSFFIYLFSCGEYGIIFALKYIDKDTMCRITCVKCSVWEDWVRLGFVFSLFWINSVQCPSWPTLVGEMAPKRVGPLHELSFVHLRFLLVKIPSAICMLEG